MSTQKIVNQQPQVYGQSSYPQPSYAQPNYANYPPPPPPGFNAQYGYPQQQQPYPPPPYPAAMSSAHDKPGHTAIPIGEPDQAERLTKDCDRSIRHGFIRKVYLLLLAQLFITFSIVAALAFPPTTNKWFMNHWWITLVMALFALIVSCVLLCVPGMAQRTPHNYILLTIFSLIIAVMLTPAAVFSDVPTFCTAMGITLILVLILTLFACQTRFDFTGCGIYLLVCLCGLTIFGFCTLIFPNDIARTVYASLGAVLFSFYIIYDTQLIVGGKHRRYQFSIDDYILGCISLYMDVINLFVFILDLLEG